MSFEAMGLVRFPPVCSVIGAVVVCESGTARPGVGMGRVRRQEAPRSVHIRPVELAKKTFSCYQKCRSTYDKEDPEEGKG